MPMDVSKCTMTELQSESTRLQSVLGALEVQLNDARRSLGVVRSEIERRSRPVSAPRVSDHALLRYIERVLGFDVEAVRTRIMTDDVKAAILAGASAVNVEGARLKVEGNVIVTVMTEQHKPKKVSKHRRPELSEDDAIREGLDA